MVHAPIIDITGPVESHHGRIVDMAGDSVLVVFETAAGAVSAALGQLGRLDEAREALAQFLMRAPGLSTEQAMRATTAFRDEAVFQHFLEGLRKAGWKG